MCLLKAFNVFKCSSAYRGRGNIYCIYLVPPPSRLSPGVSEEIRFGYYWRVDEVNEHGTTEGEVWSFTTTNDAVEALVRSAQTFSAPGLSRAGRNIVLRSGFLKGGRAVITVGDVRGRIVCSDPIEKVPGLQAISLPARASGIYIVTVTIRTTRLRKAFTGIPSAP